MRNAVILVLIYLFSQNLSAEVLSFQEWKTGKIRRVQSYMNDKKFALKKARKRVRKRELKAKLKQASQNYKLYKSLKVKDYYHLYLKNQRQLSRKEANYLSKKMSKTQLARLLEVYQNQLNNQKAASLPSFNK